MPSFGVITLKFISKPRVGDSRPHASLRPSVASSLRRFVASPLHPTFVFNALFVVKLFPLALEHAADRALEADLGGSPAGQNGKLTAR